jgi:hypothetical protein
VGRQATLLLAVVVASATAAAQPTGADGRPPDLIKAVVVPLDQNVDDLVAGR